MLFAYNPWPKSCWKYLYTIQISWISIPYTFNLSSRHQSFKAVFDIISDHITWELFVVSLLISIVKSTNLITRRGEIASKMKHLTQTFILLKDYYLFMYWNYNYECTFHVKKNIYIFYIWFILFQKTARSRI